MPCIPLFHPTGDCSNGNLGNCRETPKWVADRGAYLTLSPCVLVDISLMRIRIPDIQAGDRAAMLLMLVQLREQERRIRKRINHLTAQLRIESKAEVPPEPMKAAFRSR